ncbi:MAG: SpoIIE family protein phosphatase [candidate division Zixibacteria bacterium]|nr:SpoIIE family protein phosphatase [candidate division Zixibacteria bacterium]
MQLDKLYDLEEKIFELETRLEGKSQEVRSLANIATVITSILDIETVLSVAMENSIRQVGGEVGALLISENGVLTVKVAWGVDVSFVEKLKYKDNLDIARFCLKNKQSIIENDCSHIFPVDIPVHSFIAAPIPAKSAEAVIIIFNKENGKGFSVADRESLNMICRFTSISLDNTDLLNTQLEKQKMDQELSVAREVQATLLPSSMEFEGLQLASTYIPARQVSGDYYDFIPIDKNRILFLLGDVTNKGVPAALVMTSVHAIIHAYVNSKLPIRVTDIICQLNDILCNDVIKGREMFITLFMAFMDLKEGTMEYCNGGHPPPFYYRASKKLTQRLKPGGTLVGQFAGLPYRSTKIKIFPGDRIFTYSDGLIEAENRAGELYGLDRLEEFFKAGIMLDAKRFDNVVKEEIERFSVGSREESIDDFTTLVVDVLKEEKKKSFEFVYRSSLDNLQQLYLDLASVIDEYNIGEKLAKSLNVTISEAVTNSIIHAHKYDESKKVILKMSLNKKQLVADILDEGKCCSVSTIKDHDLNVGFLAEGGRGLGLIKKLSEEVIISLRPTGGLRVRIINILKDK